MGQAIKLQYHIHSRSNFPCRSSTPRSHAGVAISDNHANNIERIQPVVATASIVSCLSSRSRASAGVCQPNVFRGRVFSECATALNSSAPCWLRSVPLGKYWRSKPLVFSLLPLCHAARGFEGRRSRSRDRYRSAAARVGPSRHLGPKSASDAIEQASYQSSRRWHRGRLPRRDRQGLVHS